MKADNVGVRMDFILEIVNMCVWTVVCGVRQREREGFKSLDLACVTIS